VEESILDRQFGLTYELPGSIESHADAIVSKSMEFFPILADSRLVRTIIAVRVVDPTCERDDARPSEVIDHGSGCLSVFSGKIVTACRIAREIRTRVERAMGSEPSPHERARPPSRGTTHPADSLRG
jgi:glycerol-3-phosphate dehydrogenase